MSKDKTKLAKEQEALNQLVGEWEGVTRVQFGAGTPPQQDPCRGTMRAILDGKFILHEYEGSLDGKPLKGAALYGYDSGKKQFECAWVDSFHNGDRIMFSVGTNAQNNFSVLGSYEYTDEKGTTRYGWQTTIEIVNKNKIIIRMDNILPDGKKEGGVDTIYTRK